MKLYISMLVLFFSFSVYAQEKSREKLIQVAGNSRSMASPDIGILYIRLSQIDATMNKAIDGLSKKADYYTNLLVKLQFKKEDVKTTGFSVGVNKIYRRDQMVDSGYIAIQSIKLEFRNERENLTKILNKLSGGEKETDFSFDFKLSEKLKNDLQLKLIDLAIKDAFQKAELISNSTGRKILSLKTVLYGGSQNNTEPVMQRELKFASAADAGAERNYNFTPDDILFQEFVTMEWLIE